MHYTTEQLLENNRNWARQITAKDPAFFETMAQGQSPEYLWIGCADSRVSVDQITGLGLGEVFVHRNIANVVAHTDLNCLSVLQYAVDALKVPNVIVCGHYGCGGVRAALDGHKHGLVDHWLRNIQDVADKNRQELDRIEGDAKADRLSELNVLQQRENVVRTATVQGAWERGQPLKLHAWIYGLKDGLIRQLAPPLQNISAAQ